MLEIQKFFLSNSPNSFEDKVKNLKEILNLNIKIQDNKILLNYRIDSPKDSPIVNECRGLILDKDTFDIIYYPFNRFYNYGEGYAANIDWNTAEIFEKLDGTMCAMFWDEFNNQWKVSTRNMIYAEGVINENPILKTKDRSFSDLFWEIFYEKNLILTGFVKYLTYSFELCSLENKIVKEYKERDIYLLTIKDNKTGEEYTQKDIDWIQSKNIFGNVSRPKQYSISTLTLENVIDLFKDLQAQDEGFVVCDKYNNRIKVKNPKYFALSAIKNNGNIEKNIIQFIIKGERDEFLSYFPEYTEVYDRLNDKYHEIASSALRIYDLHKDKESQKEFALSIIEHPMSSLLFQLRAKRYKNLREAIENNLLLMEKILV